MAAGNEAEEAEPLQQGAAGGDGALVASGGRESVRGGGGRSGGLDGGWAAGQGGRVGALGGWSGWTMGAECGCAAMLRWRGGCGGREDRLFCRVRPGDAPCRFFCLYERNAGS